MPSSKISIITPVYAGGDQYLLAAYRSLCDQAMPPGWSWEWVVQEDGTTGVLDALPPDPRISPGMGRTGRACMARTIALGRTTGDLVRHLDADDLFADELVMAREISILSEHPEIGWTATAALDLHTDGSTTGVDTDPPPGPLIPGSVFESYQRRDLSILGTTVCARTDLVLAVGGWPAVPSSEDVGLLLALEAVARGWFIPDVGLLYRKYPGQSTSQPGFTDPTEVAARRAFITARTLALRRLTKHMSSPDGQVSGMVGDTLTTS